MTSNDMPKKRQVAAVWPILKDAILDLSLKKYRPVSNLHFIRKVVEKVVFVRLVEHVKENNLQDDCQSANRQFHSIEPVLFFDIQKWCTFRNGQ